MAAPLNGRPETRTAHYLSHLCAIPSTIGTLLDPVPIMQVADRVVELADRRTHVLRRLGPIGNIPTKLHALHVQSHERLLELGVAG